MNISQETIILPNGLKMPIVGYGTFLAKNPELEKALRAALDAGYRHIDTAFLYENEEIIGEILEEYFESGKLKREDIFISTKLWGTFMSSKELIKNGIECSLRKLKLNYIDLFLIHLPISRGFTKESDYVPMNENKEPIYTNPDLVDVVWKGMEELVDCGLAKSIGVSNFNSDQIERIHKVAKHPISTNQIEVHVFFQNKKLIEFCQKRNIPVTAYSPLGAPGYYGRPTDISTYPLENETLKEIAKLHNKTPAQILLKFLIELKLSVIPKSIRIEKVVENYKVFDFQLSNEDHLKLNSLDRNLRIFKFSKFKEITNHPEYPFHTEF